MEPQFSHTDTQQPLRIDADGIPLMPEWSERDVKPSRPKTDIPLPPARANKIKTAVVEPSLRKRVAKDLQPDATQLESVTQAKQWLKEHPEEAAMLRQASRHSNDILTDSSVTRHYSTTEAAAFFDKSVQWLYWGMRHPPHGGRLFVRPVLDESGDQVIALHDADGMPVLDERGEPILSGGPGAKMLPLVEDIPVPRIGDPKNGKRRFDIPLLREFAKSAYNRGNIKEPKLRAVLERLVVAEHGGNWKAVPIPKRQEDEKGPE